MKTLLIGLLVFGCVFFGSTLVVRAEDSDESFAPQTSSTWTDVPYPTTMPATGMTSTLRVLVLVVVFGYAGCYMLIRTKRVTK